MKAECPHCRHEYSCHDEHIGMVATCTACKRKITLGGTSGDSQQESLKKSPKSSCMKLIAGVYDTRRYEKLIKWFLLVSAILYVFACYQIWVHSKGSVLSGVSPSAVEGSRPTLRGKAIISISLLCSLCGIIAQILFVVWTYQAHANSKVLRGVKNGRRSIAALWWLCPIMNVIIPFLVLCDIAESGETDEERKEMKNTVRLFWSIHLIVFIAVPIYNLLRIFVINERESVYDLPIQIFAAFFWLLWCLLQANMVRVLGAFQRLRATVSEDGKGVEGFMESSRQ